MNKLDTCTMPATEVNKSQVSIICNINRLNTLCINNAHVVFTMSVIV